MQKLKLSLFLLCLGIITAFPAHGAQIGGKALGDVDDVVKEATHGSLEIPKHSLMLLRAGELRGSKSYFQPSIITFSSTGNSATKTLQAFSNEYEIDSNALIMNAAPVISRKSYNGKKVLMNSTAAHRTIRTYFAALSNSRTATTETPQELVNALSTSPIGNPYSAELTEESSHTFGGAVLNVKDYDGEIFVNVYGEESAAPSFKVLMNFFSINADDSGEPVYKTLDLSSTTNFTNAKPQVVSVAAADIDDDGYTDNFAVLVNTDIDVRLYFYKVVYENGTLQLKRLGDSEYKLYAAPEPYTSKPSGEASSALVAGDFDGDGKFEVAAVYKKIKREKNSDSGRNPSGRIVGDVGVHVFKWNYSKGTFEAQNSSKEYSYHKIVLASPIGTFTGEGIGHNWHGEYWSGVAGVKATAADLDGDGKDEIVTLLIGYYRMSAWDPSWKAWKGTQEEFDMYPYLAVWSCPRGTISPQHDENHVKGQGIQEGPLAKYGAGQGNLLGKALWAYKYYFCAYYLFGIYGKPQVTSSGRDEPNVKTGYTSNYLSLAAGPFTGTLGTAKTVDDVIVSWNEGLNCDGMISVYLFKTNVSGGSFSGFADASKVQEIQAAAPQEVNAEASLGIISHGLLAADFAGEGVELDVPVHVKDEGDRSYIAILNAPPYHVDTVSADGNSLQTAPHNFTYSGGGDGNMRVFYDNTAANENSKSVTFDLSNSVETIFLVDSPAVRKAFAPTKKILSFVSKFAFERRAWDGTTWVDAALKAVTDKVDTTDKTVKTTSKTITLNDDLQASTRDSIIFYNADRHIWRYPVLTNPVPEWLLSGPRIDSTSGDISGINGNAYHYLTFAMYDDGTKYVRDSLTDTEYQPIHEEGNLFSYPPALAANEGYIAGAALTTPTMWSFGASGFTSSAAFKEVSADERQTETKVTRSLTTRVIESINKFVLGANAPSYTPGTDNPQKFSKSYSKEEKIGFSLKGRNDLVNRGAGNEIAFQAYTGKEGAMTLATAVTLASTAPQNFLWRNSLYTSKADPALLLPFKFIEQGNDFIANTDNVAAMQLRGMRFYLPELLSFTDNRLICGLDYKIHVPVYNASFKATGNFTARLSYSTSNEPAAGKTALAETTISLKGWNNDRNDNKGWLVFNVPGSATQSITSGNYYLWVELDTTSAVDEVHESRMNADNRTVRDYGGNNEGYAGVVFVNMNSSNLLTKNGKGTKASFSSAGFVASASGDVGGNKTTITTNLTMNGMHNMADLDTFLNSQEDHSERIPVLCEITYSGEYMIPYASIAGYHVSDSSAKMAKYGYELENIPKSEKEEFAYATFAMIPGQTSRFYLMLCADDMKHPSDDASDTLTYFEISIPGFDVNFQWASESAVDILLGDDTVGDVYDYLEDVAAEISADAPAVSADVVTVAESRDFTLTKSSAVRWRIKDVKLRGSSASGYMIDTSISRTHSVDLSGMDTSFDENVNMNEVYAMFTPEIEPDNEVVVHVSSVPYVTKKGVYEIHVQTSTGKVSKDDGNADEENNAEEIWTDEETLIFEVSANSNSTPNTNNGTDNGNNTSTSSSGGGCNSGLGVMAMMLTLGVMFFKRRS